PAPGVVFMPFHFAEAAANVLTNPALDPKAKIPEFKVCAVRIDRLPHEGNQEVPVIPVETSQPAAGQESASPADVGSAHAYDAQDSGSDTL
ncbi:MAG TPA: hypothetical protein GX529_09580, partial [Firmicutes bacterium]|nr:hypothetical protein [Candidatus Fermentithermobacillaceae bacterium]